MSDGSERTEDGQIMWGGFAGSFCGNITSSHISAEPGLPLLELESKVRTSKKVPILRPFIMGQRMFSIVSWYRLKWESISRAFFVIVKLQTSRRFVSSSSLYCAELRDRRHGAVCWSEWSTPNFIRIHVKIVKCLVTCCLAVPLLMYIKIFSIIWGTTLNGAAVTSN